MQKIFITLLSIVLFTTSCEDDFWAVDHVYSINMQNNSSNIVIAFYQNNYPDTSIASEVPLLHGIKPSVTTSFDSHDKWEDKFSAARGHKLSFFVISADTFNTYPWEIIRTQYKILKRYDLSLQDVQSNDWMITYP